MPDPRTPVGVKCSKCDQIDRIASVCDQLNRTLRGNNGEVGLVAQVAVLVEQNKYLVADLQDHIREHQADRDKQKIPQTQVLERVILWLLVAVLSLSLAGDKLESLKHVAPLVQPSSAPSLMP